MRVRSRIAAGRARAKFISTITSVPPHSGSASGRSAFAASASSQVVWLQKLHRGRIGAGAKTRTRAALDSATRLVGVAQLVELRVVVPAVAGSNPVAHP